MITSLIKQRLLSSFLLSAMLGVGCQSLPKTPHLPKSLALTAQTHLRQQTPAVPLLNISPSQQGYDSAYHLILTGNNALEIRRTLIHLAKTSIDIQYYIWRDDELGRLLLQDLWHAANRGVIVRLLLDDLNTHKQLDQKLIALASHPNIAVRLINPTTHRHYRPLGYLTDITRMNRRMHNKSMIFDNQLAIIGGRNIGNAYLNSQAHSQFADMDVLLTGAVSQDISKSFANYWQSPLAFDIQVLMPTQNADDIQKNIAFFAQPSPTPTQPDKLQFEYANIRFVSDDVGKLQNDKHSQHLIDILQNQFGTPQKKLSIISSYFVPTKAGVDTLINLARHGVDIHILTNAYEATDVGLVHAGYAHWRKDLLKAGVHLYELKAINRTRPTYHKDNQLWRTLNTTTSLHAKAFAVDDKQVFIGSYNIDPRSANFNTELGVVIDDKALAKQLHQVFDNHLLEKAYKLTLNQNKLEWHTLENGQLTTYTQEPGSTPSNQLLFFLLAYLPIDWLL